jgi:hypothetical protein
MNGTQQDPNKIVMAMVLRVVESLKDVALENLDLPLADVLKTTIIEIVSMQAHASMAALVPEKHIIEQSKTGK